MLQPGKRISQCRSPLPLSSCTSEDVVRASDVLMTRSYIRCCAIADKTAEM